MNLHVQDLLNDFEYEVKQGHYKKMDYRTWQELNAQRSSPVNIKILTTTDIVFIVNGREYIFDIWDGSFGEFLNEIMAMEIKIDSSGFDALSAATASASNSIQSSCEALKSISNTYVYSTDSWTATSIGSNFYEKQQTVEINEKGLKINGQSVNEMIDEALCNSIS
jgi:hypothetical protein